MPKSSILFSTNHSTFSKAFSESCLLATLRRACTCALWRMETFWMLQDFRPLQHSVSPMVSLVTEVPTVSRSLISSFRTVLAPSHDHPHPMSQDVAWILGHFIFLLFLNSHTNSCHHLNKLLAGFCCLASCLHGLVLHLSFIKVYNLVLDVLWQLFGLVHGDHTFFVILFKNGFTFVNSFRSINLHGITQAQEPHNLETVPVLNCNTW